MADDELIIVSDEDERVRLNYLAANLLESELANIIDASEKTNLRISAVVNMALAATDWDNLGELLNEAESLIALAEADDVLHGDAEESP